MHSLSRVHGLSKIRHTAVTSANHATHFRLIWADIEERGIERGVILVLQKVAGFDVHLSYSS